MILVFSRPMPFSWEIYDEKAYIQICEVSILHISSVLSQFPDTFHVNLFSIYSLTIFSIQYVLFNVFSNNTP
jgi:hypothetical protein